MTLSARRQHGTRSASRWLVGAIALLVAVVAGASPAFADGDCCTETEKSEPDELDTDCEFKSATSGMYNACFVANPVPASAMPDWLAKLQARNAVDTVFNGLRAVHADATDTDAEPVASPAWLDDVVDTLRQFETAHRPGSGCFEGQYDTECRDLPSPAVLVAAGSTLLADRTYTDIELPFEPDEADSNRRPIVDLTVGPADGHDSPPDRPPPV